MAVRFPNDGIMAPPAYIRQVHTWAREAFMGEAPDDGRIRIRVLRQDHAWFRYGRSCIETPLRVGAQTFKHGLGVHAFSDIEVAVPEGARRFEASVGVDCNPDTGGIRGSVEFVVEVDGQETLRTPVLAGGAAPVPVVVRVGPEVRTLRLKVTDGGDGVAYDQADWCDAAFVMEDGSRRYLDAGQADLPMVGSELPMSFVLGSRPSAELLPGWKRTSETTRVPGGRRLVSRFEEPGDGIVLTVEARVFDRYPAVEWVATFENRGKATSALLSDVRALDMQVASGFSRLPLVLHHLQGDTCSATAFMPLETIIDPQQPFALAPTGGRPSSMTAFPFWNLRFEDMGMIAAIGWTGQWRAEFARKPSGPGSVHAGMELLRTVLLPGEAIRTPRILIMPWKGARPDAQIRFRRLMLDHFSPRVSGRVPSPPLAIQTFDRYYGRPDWATEAGQLVYARTGADLGFDTLWLDAAWFPGGFPNGVGTWRADPTRFPRGLKPVSDAAHERGMRFVLWFEPERVAQGSEIARDHPDWVFGGASGGLFKLHVPEARDWLTEQLARAIGECGVDVYRNDFNMDPLPSWRAGEAPDRQGMTEMRYVEGLYVMWDALRARFPNLLIDNCSSGGRRLDLEMMTRSMPLWRSDTGCSAGHPEWNQMQSMALAQYLPMFTVGLWSATPYERRSAGTAGASVEVPYLEPGFNPKPWADTVRELTELRGNWFGDFYPLTGASVARDQMAVWQLHRPDTGSGAIYGFRRPDCGLAGLVVTPRGIVPDATYRVEILPETGKTAVVKMTGQNLLDGMVLRVPTAPGSVVVRYARVGPAEPKPTAAQGRGRKVVKP
jgi:alpha-galactosidase